MKQFVIFILSLVLFGNSIAQANFSAIVVDKNGNPVNNIEIFDSEDFVTSTNESGYFEISSKNNFLIVHGYRGKDLVFGHKFN